MAYGVGKINFLPTGCVSLPLPKYVYGRLLYKPIPLTMNAPQILTALAAAAALGLTVRTFIQAFRRADDAGPLTVFNKETGKTVTLPAHYSEDAMQKLHDVLAG